MSTWHQRISWNLGRHHAIKRLIYRRPWWINEAYYALGYAYAKYIENPAAKEPPASPGLVDFLVDVAEAVKKDERDG
jgi:hypothetical protein